MTDKDSSTFSKDTSTTPQGEITESIPENDIMQNSAVKLQKTPSKKKKKLAKPQLPEPNKPRLLSKKEMYQIRSARKSWTETKKQKTISFQKKSENLHNFGKMMSNFLQSPIEQQTKILLTFPMLHHYMSATEKEFLDFGSEFLDKAQLRS